MESGNAGASSQGVLVPVPEASDVFLNDILTPLKSAYLYEESKQSFKYESALLVKNPALEEKYDAFRASRRAAGYTEEDLKESYGFLLFEDVNKAKTLGETGVLAGNSTCTILGDPTKGIYISMYSDCLDLNRWYHGKSGYIAIIRLTRGKVKKVLENYTQNFTAPTVGFDCHVSEQLPSVSDKTSSFLAFERTQYYMYELLVDGSNETAQSPSAACPYAIVSFSYTDTKSTPAAPQEKSNEKRMVSHYFLWKGQLQIEDLFYNVSLRSTSGAIIPAALPPVVKVERAISVVDLRQLLPKAVFETCFSGEVILDDLCCSLCEFISSSEEGTSSLSLLLYEIKEKNVAFTIPLNDGGFLILLHSSHFLTYDDMGSCSPEVLQGVFVFPDSRVIQRGTKFGHRKPAIPSEVLRVLPLLSYAESEVEKTSIDPSEELSEVLTQHMQSYATLINPGLELSPSREVSIFADQYDVPDAHKHLYTCPEWTDKAWHSLKSYLSKPASFQLPVAKASEILVAGQENQIEDLDDDLYICLSSPEEAPAKVDGSCSEDKVAGQESSVNVETSVDNSVTSVETAVDLRLDPQTDAPDYLQVAGSDKDNDKPAPSVQIKTDVSRTKNLLIPATSEELPAELIVSITSAERTDDSVICTESAAKHNDLQISDFSAAKSQVTGADPLSNEIVGTEKLLNTPEVNSFMKTKGGKIRKGHSRGRRKVFDAGVETPSVPTVQTPVENDNLSQKEDLAKELVDQQPSNPSIADWRKVRRRKRVFGKLSPRNKKVASTAVCPASSEEKKTGHKQQSLESPVFMELESCPLRKKTERWDLKPVVSECGRILVPHGSVDSAGIKSLKDKLQSTKFDQGGEKMLVVSSEDAHDTVEMEHKSATAPEKEVDKMETTTFKDGGNHLKNLTVSPVLPNHSVLSPGEAGNDSSSEKPKSSVCSLKQDVTDLFPSQDAQENRSDTLSKGKSPTKGEFLLSKLKSVLLRGKRKAGLFESDEMIGDPAQATEPLLKISKVNSDTGILKGGDNDLGFKELSVDPLFAYALGLTPKEIPNMVKRTDGPGTQQREDSSQAQEQTIFDKHQIIQRPPSIFSRRGRIKTLKKHQDISAENVKKKCTPFQVSPLSGSTGLLHHQTTMYDDGSTTLEPSVVETDRGEQVCRTPDYLKKQTMRRRKFRHSRTFVNKDGSIQVTKQWTEDYDFSLDSKFASDSEVKAVIRALHGPWDNSVQDTSEEVRLIVHMWIGLFYSRSTSRFFHIDSDLTYPFPEDSDSLEMSSAKITGSDQSELKTNSDALSSSVVDTSEPSTSKALDLSKKDDSAQEKGTDQGSVVLDLSLKNSSTEAVTSDAKVSTKDTCEKMDTRKTLNTKSYKGEQEVNQEIAPSMKMINEGDVFNSIQMNNETCTPLQTACLLGPTNLLLVPIISVQRMVGTAAVPSERNPTASGLADILQESSSERTDLKDCTGSSEPTEIGLHQPHGGFSTESMMDDSSKEAGNVTHTVQHIETEPKDGKNLEVQEKPHRENNKELYPELTQAVDNFTEKVLGAVCNGNLLENEKQCSSEEPVAVSEGVVVNAHCPFNEKAAICDDHAEKEDRLVEKDSSIPAVDAKSDVGNQTLSAEGNGSDSVKQDDISESNGQGGVDGQPTHADKKEDSLNDLQLGMLCANGKNEHTIPEKAPKSPLQMETIDNEPEAEENHTCSVDEAEKEESTCSLDGSHADQSALQTKDKVETSNDEVMTDLNLISDDHETWDAKSVDGEKMVVGTTQEEIPICQAPTEPPAEIAVVKDTDVRGGQSDEEMEKYHGRVVIPFIGVDISGEDTELTHHSQSKVKETVQGQERKAHISEPTHIETPQPTEVCFTSQVNSQKAELSFGKVTGLNIPENNQPLASEKEPDDRCPTPTMDEKPYGSLPCSGASSVASPSRSRKSHQKGAKKYLSRSSLTAKNEMPIEQKFCHKSTVNGDPHSHHGLHPDLELRTLRVFQSIGKYLSKSTEKSGQIESTDMKHSLDQTSIPNNMCILADLPQSHLTKDSKGQKMSNIKVPVSASMVQELQTESAVISQILPFKRKIEEVLGVGLQLNKTDSSAHLQYSERAEKSKKSSSHPHQAVPSSGCLEAVKPNVDQDRHTTTSPANLGHEQRPYSKRPVMAVKPSKSDESQADGASKERQMENSAMLTILKNKRTKESLEKKTECFKRNSERLSNKLLLKNSPLSHESGRKSEPNKAKFERHDPVHQYKGREMSKNNYASSLPVKNLGSSPSLSQPLVEKRSLGEEKVVQTAKQNLEMKKRDCITSLVDYKGDSEMDDDLYLGPDSSLTCTVYNNSKERSSSFLEQMSNRCVQDDPTEASMEQECLIFSEKMKQLLKRSKMGSINQLDSQDKLSQSCLSPVTVTISSLEKQGVLVENLATPTLFGQKLKVEMSDREHLAATEEGSKSQKSSTPVEHAGVSRLTAEFAELYEETMNDVCAVSKVPSKSKHLGMDRGYSKTDPNNYFDFCDQMKREMDESFRSNLNSVVKKSCKTKYRFYILETSDNAFFGETKAQLEAEGHTAVQPSEFFLEMGCSLFLLIILRNEDIAEHICEIPHLLELKKSPGVQFAGIDEPDDVINLTHQELFTKGGFIMLDRATLEHLNLCDMKKMSEILEELSRMGKWKWMLHYRDSRRLKENARLSAEAKEKRNFLNCCQEAGIMEVLPYHECDHMSRDQPDYFTCLARLQVQNISARYTVFITDSAVDGVFRSHGIMTMTFSSFLSCSPSEVFSV
ncbi:uncharacterized protein tasor2 isoform X2 [Cheilinus undulatus]|uniref:uncharacterized protein tasor2 isoform X2 n=1 Tax=Cheilinus undulatus TaxID=241271 RepID=UPI001BD1DB6F|nr:uncharacterized protein tasor2 isoform X2 [Cheilinus undulatus]